MQCKFVMFQALTDALKMDPHVHQPSLEIYEDSSLFFLAYAQVSTRALMLYFF